MDLPVLYLLHLATCFFKFTLSCYKISNTGMISWVMNKIFWWSFLHICIKIIHHNGNFSQMLKTLLNFTKIDQIGKIWITFLFHVLFFFQKNGKLFKGYKISVILPTNKFVQRNLFYLLKWCGLKLSKHGDFKF